MYDERTPLYEKYADIVVDEKNLDVEETLQKSLENIAEELTARVWKTVEKRENADFYLQIHISVII